MKIEPGYWRCRNGSRARVLCTDAPGDYPVVGYVILPSGNIELCQWTSTGGFWFSHEESRCDLIEPWRDEPAQDETVSLTLSELAEFLTTTYQEVYRHGGITPVDTRRLLVQARLLSPSQQQPVRVSGWVRLYPNGMISGIWDAEEEALDSMTVQVKAVYVTGTEGVGPGGDE